jgi:hypothetical protein
MLESLAEWTSAVGAVGARPHIKMRVEIDDAAVLVFLCVTEVMAKCGFVSAA